MKRLLRLLFARGVLIVCLMEVSVRGTLVHHPKIELWMYWKC